MRIEGNDYRINVLILLMEKEVDVTIQTVEALLETLEEGVTVSILLNGGHSDILRTLFSKYDSIKYYESDQNLGVAGGRNYLLRTPESLASDIIMILDNDVIPPLDYIRSLSTFLIKHKEAGVVGAAAADAKAGLKLSIVKHYGEGGCFGNKIFKFTTKDIKENLLRDLKPGRLFHIGVHHRYRYSYFSIISVLANDYPMVFGRRYLFGIPVRGHHILRFNDYYLKLIKSGIEKYTVSNVAGCSQAFRRELIDEIGCLDDRFSPYGYEDVDFNIRALKAGYHNYIDTNTWLFHGTDTRHADRNYYKMLTNVYRCKTILASSVFSNSMRYRFVILKLIFGGFLFDLSALRSDAIKRLRVKLQGFRKGLEIIREQSHLREVKNEYETTVNY
jgi:GT2 family glycosyltransferase